MSREIDFSKPLSEEEAAYVADRPWISQDADLQGVEIVEDETEEIAETEPEAEIEEIEAEEIVEDETEEVAPYEEWDFAELKAEAESRGLAKSGSKENIIDRLKEDDESSEA